MGARRIVLRADSGLEIGTGHVMRCLTLADALCEVGVEPVFVTRAHRGHVIPAITDRGYRVAALPGNTGAAYGLHPAPPAHARWLEADWRADAAATRAVLEEEEADWLVMDHYALDQAWQGLVLRPGLRMMVLDDLADRPHLADVLIDQNAGRSSRDYDGLVPANCELRTGPEFALLRPEFAQLRPQTLARRETLEHPVELLVTLGGIDKDNHTQRMLDALDEIGATQRLRITVIMGQSAPWLAKVQARAEQMCVPTEVAAGVSDMAERMAKADFCIGAAGSTSWERCVLGLPTLQVVLASNQVKSAHHLAGQGVVLALPKPGAPEFNSALAKGLCHLHDQGAYRTMSRAAAKLTDGTGTTRVAELMAECGQVNNSLSWGNL